MIEQLIYTSCDTGQGYENTSGLQVKARSSGIDDALSQAIMPYCNHYNVPRDLGRRENRYYADGENLPPAILDRYPVVVTYFPVDDKRFGLTRIHYLGKDHSNRPGNFWAHTLILAPGDLAPFAYSPLSLARSSFFQEKPSGKTLESLPDLKACTPGRPALAWDKPEAREHCAEAIPGLLAVLSAAAPGDTKPIILRHKMQPEAAPLTETALTELLIETLLMLLPPDFRARMPFTTYEPDPMGLLSRGGKRLRILGTLSEEAGGLFEFRAHEMAEYWLWDAAANRRSTFPSPSPYVQVVQRHYLEGDTARITARLQAITDVGAGRDPAAWDTLIDLDKLAGGAPAEAVKILSSLARVAQSPAQAARAIGYALPLLEGAPEAIQPSVQQSAQQLAQRLSPVDRATFESELVRLVEVRLNHHDVERAKALAAVGSGGVLRQACERLEKQGWPSLTDVETPQRLAVVRALAQESALAGWLAGVIWARVRATLVQLPDDLFRAVMAMLTDLSDLRARLAAAPGFGREVETLCSQMLRGGQVDRAWQVRTWSGGGPDLVLAVYRDVYREFATDHPRSGAVPEADALFNWLNAALNALLDSEPPQRVDYTLVLPAFYAAGYSAIVDRLWKSLEKRLLETMGKAADQAAAFRFAERLRAILQAHSVPTDALLTLEMRLNPPSTEADWTERLDALIRARPADTYQAAKDGFALMNASEPVDKRAQVFVDMALRAGQSDVSRAALEGLTELAAPLLAAPDWPLLGTLLEQAHRLTAADQWWASVKGRELIARAEKPSVPEATDFCERAVKVLSKYTACKPCNDDVYLLVMRGLDEPPARTAAEWDQAIDLLVASAQQGTEARAKITKILKMFPVEPVDERARLIAHLCLACAGNRELLDLVSAAYRDLLKALPDNVQPWDIRRALAGCPGGDVLLFEEMTGEIPRENDRFQAAFGDWDRELFWAVPAVVGALASLLARALSMAPEDAGLFALADAFLYRLGLRDPASMTPLVRAYVLWAPLVYLVSRPLDYRLEATLRHESADVLSRLVFARWLIRLSGCVLWDALGLINEWPQVAGPLSQADQTWAEAYALKTITKRKITDFEDDANFVAVVNRCLQEFANGHIDFVLNTMMPPHADAFVQTVWAVLFGWIGMCTMHAGQDATNYALLVGELLKRQREGLREQAWQALALVNPALCQDFQRLAAPGAIDRARRLFGRLIGRSPRQGQA